MGHPFHIPQLISEAGVNPVNGWGKLHLVARGFPRVKQAMEHFVLKGPCVEIFLCQDRLPTVQMELGSLNPCHSGEHVAVAPHELAVLTVLVLMRVGVAIGCSPDTLICQLVKFLRHFRCSHCSSG